MPKISKTMVIVASIFTTFSNSALNSGFFSDNEARQAILDVRHRIDLISARLNTKTDNTSSISLLEQEDRLNQEIAKQTGKIEVLANEIFLNKAFQKDLYKDLDTRLCRLESHRVIINRQKKEISAFSQKIYDMAMASFKAGKYKAAVITFSNFLNLKLDSNLNASAQYWLGCAYYALGNYDHAIATQNIVVKKYPGDVKAAEAMLNIASSYTEINDKFRAQKVLDQLIVSFPDTPAAKVAKEKRKLF